MNIETISCIFVWGIARSGARPHPHPRANARGKKKVVQSLKRLLSLSDSEEI
jgi:hypothetical protein